MSGHVKMTRFFCRTIAVLAGLLMTAGISWAWTGTVVKVIDGDSLVVRGPRGTVEIRLYGIDTPEYRQPFSNKAKQLSRRLVYRREVQVRQKDVDRYGRVVAVVSIDGTTLNRELVARGLAWYYARYCREQPLCRELESLEEDARGRGAGLWRDRDPTAPWDWKRRQRERSVPVSGPPERFLSWLQAVLWRWLDD